MALTKPIVSIVNAFDASNDNTFYFTSSGGDQVVKNEIKIINNDTSVLVYSNTETTYQYNQVVPSGTLTNGVYYAVAFRTYDIYNNTSDWSDYLPFYCYTTPTLSFNIINGDTVGSASFNVVLNYDQLEDELLNYATISLYDENFNRISNSGNLYNSSNPPLSVSYMIQGLIDGETYKIGGVIETVNGTIVSTDYITFDVVYSAPTLYSTLELTSNNCEGYINLKSDIIAIDGISNPTPPIYIDGQEVCLASCDNDITHTTTSSWVEWEEGYKIPTNALIRIWFKPAMIKNLLAKFNSTISSEVLDIRYVRGVSLDYITITTNSGTVLTTNGISHCGGNDDCFLWIKIIGNSWDVVLEKLNTIPTIFNWNDNTNNVKYNMSTNLTYVGESFESYSIPTQNEVILSGKLNRILLGNGVYSHINITSDTSISYTTSIPTWDKYTILDCNFNNNINGGNINVVLNQLTGITIKRKDINTSNWVSIFEKSITSANDLLIDIKDSSTPNLLEQTYAIVPILQGGIEGDYITDTVTPNWNGTFISDGETIFKLFNAVVYDTTTQNIPIGVLTPIGATYPIVIQNSNNNYRSGGVQAQLLGYNFETTRKVSRTDIVKQVNDFTTFMTNGKSKFIIDWNGNSILFKMMSSPTISYNSSYGNGVVNVAFTWVQQGVYNNENDLINNGFLQ